jgi:hypothetical protein
MKDFFKEAKNKEKLDLFKDNDFKKTSKGLLITAGSLAVLGLGLSVLKGVTE